MSTSEPGGNFGTVFHPEPDPLPPSNGGPIRIGQLRSLPRRRRPGMIALAVVLIGAGILGGAALYKSVNHQVPVLLVNASVPAGTVITAGDLTTTSVAASSGVQLVPAHQESQVVGLVAATNLRPGMLLATADLATALPPTAGQVLVPVALKPYQLPANGLTTGDHVLMVWTPSSSAAASAQVPASPIAAVVEDLGGIDQDGEQVVDLLVPASVGTGLARETADNDVALIVTRRVP